MGTMTGATGTNGAKVGLEAIRWGGGKVGASASRVGVFIGDDQNPSPPTEGIVFSLFARRSFILGRRELDTVGRYV